MPPIESVSDTARWIAAYRATESERPDAIFTDPFARRLAGARGEEILETLPKARESAWALVVRTKVFDDIVLDRVRRERVDLVVNLAAGLDTRAWRLDLPSSLRWVDVDLPGILQYKTDMLRDETPRCKYEAIHADLTDVAVRDALFAQLGASASRVLVITEGLLVYLEEARVQSLARALHAIPSFRWWLTDLSNHKLLELLEKQWGPTLTRGNAPMKFAVDDAESFFAPLGWRVQTMRYAIVEAHHFGREMRMGWFTRWMLRISPAKQVEEVRRMSTFVVMERA